MAFTYVTVTHTFEVASDVPASGTVEFTPVAPMQNEITVVAAPVKATLTVAGLMSQKLAANTDPGTTPTGTTYKVVERLTGQPVITYYVQVPHDQGPTLDLRVSAGWVGGSGSGGGGGALPSTILNRVVEVNGVYPARPSTGYSDFLGITDPTVLMQTGDTWTELPATVPNAPTIGTATGGNTQASVAFTAPSWNGGASITGYTATSTPGGLTGTGSSSPITVTGLTNGTAYTFKVKATNSVGSSADSAASNSVTPSAGATVPGAPTIGTATGGNASATVAFTPPGSNGGSAITGYTATSTPGSLTGTGSSSPVTVSGLTNGTAYTFTVHATNAIGNSAESAASNSVTPSAGGGGGGTAPSVSSGTLFAQFAADALSLSNGANVTTWTKSGGTMTGDLTSSGTAPTFQTNQLNGKPAVRFAGVGRLIAATGGQTLSTPFTRFIVCRSTTGHPPDGVSNEVIVDSSSSTTTLLYASPFNSNSFGYFGTGGSSIISVTGVVFTNPNVVELAVNGASTSFGVNGSLNNAGDPGSASQVGLSVGGASDSTAFYFGDIFEVLIYAGALNTTDRTAVRQYLGTKYGITVT